MVIKTNITKMLGIEHPIIAAPMGPFFTTKLTIAVSEAGGLGVLSHTGLYSEFQAKRFPTEIMKENMLEVIEQTEILKEKIQCITGHNFVPFGKAQGPALWDYADGIDTIEFLLKKKCQGIL